MIGSSFDKSHLAPEVGERNSWATANNIGYYTTKDNKIKFQYFQPYDGGQYESQQGIIKHDSIILYEKFNLLFKSEVRYDTLIRSSYRLK